MTKMEAILAAVAGLSSAIAAADRILAKASSIIHNDAFSFLWAILKRQPVKASALPTKGAEPMRFNFNTFFANLGTVAAGAAQTYDQKQQEGKSLHQVDYIHLGVGFLGAILSAVESNATPPQQ